MSSVVTTYFWKKVEKGKKQPFDSAQGEEIQETEYSGVSHPLREIQNSNIQHQESGIQYRKSAFTP